MCLILLLSVSPSLLFFGDRSLGAQGSSRESELQRLGTSNVLDPPDGVSLVFTNHNNASINEQFILLGNIQATRQDVAISNPDYGLSTPIPTLMIGNNFIIDSSNDADIVYSKATVKLVPITSPFPPANMNIEDIDPESDISLGTPITIGSYTGDSGTFAIPDTAGPGYYLLYVYYYYPTYNLTAVYNTAVQLRAA
jgi:hypothetical protein